MNLVDSFSEFKAGKNIDRPTMVRVLEDVFRTLIRKKYGSDENFDVIVNTQNGDLEMWRVRLIVPDGEVTEQDKQISFSEAQAIDDDYEIGEECYEQLTLIEFGRRAIMAARQTLISRIMDLEKDEIYKKYMDRVGEIVLGEVSQIMKREVLILDDVTGNELVIPRNEMIRGDYFRKGDMVRGVIRRGPDFQIDNLTGDGSTTAFTLTNSGVTANNAFVYYNGVCLKPSTDYGISGTTITFTFAPVSASEIMVRYQL